MTLDKRSFTSGHFELQIDGHATTAYLKSVEGGHVRASTVDEPVGPHNERIKHTSTVDVEPFSLDMGLSGANDVIKWIQSSWQKQFNRRNGQITHADFDLFAMYEHQFYNALITETTFPSLDGASKEAGYIKIKFQPETVKTSKPTGKNRITGNMGGKQKLWIPSSFRFNIDGIDEMRFTNKIEAFTIKQGVKKHYVGEERFPQIEPTKIEYPNIVGTISLEYADKLLQWHDRYVMKGGQDTKEQKSGSIEFLAPDRKSTIFAINLFGIGIPYLTVLPSSANADQIKRVKFELFVHHMELDGPGLGME